MNITANQRRTVLKLFNISETARLLGWPEQDTFRRIRTGQLNIACFSLSEKKPKAEPKQKNQYADLLAGLRSLGLEVTAAQVEPVVKELFPAGIQNLDSGEVIRGVFLRLKRQNVTDNVGR